MVFTGSSASLISVAVFLAPSTTYTLGAVANSCGTGTVSGTAVVTVNYSDLTPIHYVRLSTMHGAGTLTIIADLYYYALTTAQSMAGGDQLSFALTGILNPEGTIGLLNVSSVILPISLVEAKITNNTDAEKVEYLKP